MGKRYRVTADPSRRRLWMPPRPLNDEPEPTRRPPLVPDGLPLLLVEGENRISPPEEADNDDRLSGPAPNAYASTVHEHDDDDEDPAMASRTIAAAATTLDDDDEGADRSILLFHSLYLSGQKTSLDYLSIL